MEYKRPKREEVWISSNGYGNHLLQNVIYNDLKILWEEQSMEYAPLSFILKNKEIIYDMLKMLMEEEKE